MNSHRFDILHYPESITNVSVHFNKNGLSLNNFSFTPIDRAEAEWPPSRNLDALSQYPFTKWNEL